MVTESTKGNRGCLFRDRESLQRKLFGKNWVESLTIRQGNRSEIRAKRGKIQYNHNQGEKIHSHCQSDGDMHGQNANQPNEPSLFHPNENYVTEFDQTD